MRWVRINRKRRTAVGYDSTIYTANDDGSLEVRGAAWKSCPVDMGEGQCRRPGQVRPPEKCRRCSYNPVVAQMGYMQGAVRLAEAINRQMVKS